MTSLTKNQTIDQDQARELYLFAINDGELYERTILPSIKMMQKHIKRNKFDEEKAIHYYANTFAKMTISRYNKEFGGIGVVNQATKNAFGKEVYEHLKEQIFIRGD